MTAAILEQALDGERISDADALKLYEADGARMEAKMADADRALGTLQSPRCVSTC